MPKTLCQFGPVMFDELEQVAVRRGGFASLRWLKGGDTLRAKIVAGEASPVVAHVAAYSGRVRSAIASARQIVNLAEARLKAAETITDVASKAANAAGGTATGFDLKPFDVSIRAAKDAIAGAETAMPSPVADGEDPPPTWLTSIDEAIDGAIDAVGLAIKTRAGAMGTILDARTRINPAPAALCCLSTARTAKLSSKASIKFTSTSNAAIRRVLREVACTWSSPSTLQT